MSQTAILEQPLSEEQFAKHVRKNGEVIFEQEESYSGEKGVVFSGMVPMPKGGWVVDYGSERDPEEMVDLSKETDKELMDCLFRYLDEIQDIENEDLADRSILASVDGWEYQADENRIVFWGQE